MTYDGFCAHCRGAIAIRNPTGKCDHLYYPENCETCSKGKTKPNTVFLVESFDECFGVYSTAELAEGARLRVVAEHDFGPDVVKVSEVKIDADRFVEV